MTEESFVLEPTVLLRSEGDKLATVTAGKGEDEALMVFRTPEEAKKYQEHTGKHTPKEGFTRVQIGDEVLADLLSAYGIHNIVMPEPWIGAGGVDLFTAENFFRLLKESEV